jgi:hypothetical protein
MDPWVTAYIVIAAVALVLNGVAIYHLLRFGSLKAITTRLILLLHVSIFIDNIGNLPLVYNGNDGACLVIGFFYYYGALANILTITLLTAVYYNFVFDKAYRNAWVKKYSTIIVLGVPLITLLPYSTHSYVPNRYWCILKSGTWSYMVYFPLIVVLLFCSSTFIYILYYSWPDEAISKTLLSTVGTYIALSWIAWIITVILSFVEIFHPFTATGAISILFSMQYFTAIAYTISFAYNYSLFMKYELEAANTSRVDPSLNITFEAFEDAIFGIRFDHDRDNESERASNPAGRNHSVASTRSYSEVIHGLRKSRLSNRLAGADLNKTNAADDNSNNIRMADLERSDNLNSSSNSNDSYSNNSRSSHSNIRKSNNNNLQRESDIGNPIFAQASRRSTNPKNSIVHIDRESSFDDHNIL